MADCAPRAGTISLAAIAGLSADQQRAYIDQMVTLIAVPGLDVDVQRRAQWLLWGLEGRDVAAEIRMLQQQDRP